MGIHYHRARRADVLADGLAELLACAPADPFAAEVVAVPTRGIERFLAQRLGTQLGAGAGGRDGVCANIQFPAPAAMLAQLRSAGLPADVVEPAAGLGADPWRGASLVWAIAQELPDLAGQPGCQTVSDYLREPGRLLATSGRVARLLRSYEDERPDLVASWAQRDPRDAGVPPDTTWQVVTWQRLLRRLGPSPATQLPGLIEALRDNPELAELPARLSLFGPTRLSTTALRLLEAIGAHREVHLWLVDPSPAAWGERATHPLVASLGRDYAALSARLREVAHTEELLATPAPPPTLLGQLQSDIAANRPPEFHPELTAADRSLSIHACHGSARQVEVARELILGFLADDPTLQPRDIMVMCPDLDTFAPLFSAAFAGGPTDHLADLRLRIADRTSQQANEVLAVLARTLDLLRGRVTVGDTLDLLGRPAVARTYQLDADDLARVGELAASSGVRWGLDRDTRARYSMSGIELGTWSFGLDRMLLGVAMGEDDLATFAEVLPLDDVGSPDVRLVGALARYVAVLAGAQRFVCESHTLPDWVKFLDGVATELATPPIESLWMTSQASATLHAPLVELTANAAGDTAGPVMLHLEDVRWLLREALAGRPTRSNFRSGGLTVAGLMPMRAVPHRVVVLVGLDDGAFPRAAHPDGEDILARDPLPGERNPRTEERQLLLDAIMAAQEHLAITYCGADDRTNEVRPPAVPVAEILDVVATMLLAPGVPGTRPNPVLVRHPLAPYDPRNFTPGLFGGEPFSHDQQALTAARTTTGQRVAPAPFLPGPLPAAPDGPVTLDNLERFLANPYGHLLRTRLGLPGATPEPPPEQLPVALKGLSAWDVGDRLLAGLLHGFPPQSLARVERLRGTLPPGILGAQTLREVGQHAQDVHSRTTALRPPATDMVRVGIDLPDGTRLTGTVTDCVLPTGGSSRALVVRASYSKLGPGRLLGLWAALLAVACTAPEHQWAAALVAQDGTRALGAPPAQQAGELLGALCGLLAAGSREALPIPPGPAHAYAAARRRGRSPDLAQSMAEKAWSGKFADASKPEARRIWGPAAPFAVITAAPPEPGEEYPGEDTRFGVLARAMWEPLLAHEILDLAQLQPQPTDGGQ